LTGVAEFTLVIGNKNYSSWSLRPWLAMRQAAIPFEEILVPLYQADSKQRLLQQAKVGKVPILKHGPRVIWDSLAILEYLAEQFPDRELWPTDRQVRGVARAAAAEMHGGFAALRRQLPMDIRARRQAQPRGGEVAADILRIRSLWQDCRAQYGASGPFLFGRFSIADAMYAPVAVRFRSYAVPLDAVSQAYSDALLTLPAFKEWEAAGQTEPWTISYANP
jgi:glutathione S-transferase